MTVVALRTALCAECGEPVSRGRHDARFCSPACRKGWNNRRAMRGAELYDLFMALRFDREEATRMSVWRLLCRLTSIWRDEDARLRGARKSWRMPRQALAERPYLHADVLSKNIAGVKRR